MLQSLLHFYSLWEGSSYCVSGLGSQQRLPSCCHCRCPRWSLLCSLQAKDLLRRQCGHWHHGVQSNLSRCSMWWTRIPTLKQTNHHCNRRPQLHQQQHHGHLLLCWLRRRRSSRHGARRGLTEQMMKEETWSRPFLPHPRSAHARATRSKAGWSRPRRPHLLKRQASERHIRQVRRRA